MKKLLAIITLLFSAELAVPQCTPNPLYTDSVYGVWPDTTENFPPAEVGLPYSTVMDFVFPTDGGAIDPQYAGMPVDSGVVTNVAGLPPGITYSCNVPSCSWLGGQQGCALLSGTCNTLGIYDIVIYIDGWSEFGGFPFKVPLEFPGYRIYVTPVGIEEAAIAAFNVRQNNPNPFTGKTEIVFFSPTQDIVEFSVYNMLGEIVEARSIVAESGENAIIFKPAKLPRGMYLYSVSNGERSITRKMVITDR